MPSVAALPPRHRPQRCPVRGARPPVARDLPDCAERRCVGDPDIARRARCRRDPATLPAERYKAIALRVGQSNEAANTANRDQDFTLEVSSGSRTAAFRASSLHRLLFPDPPPFGPAKIVMQTLRLSVARLVECGVDQIQATFGPLPWYSTGAKRALSTPAICSSLTNNALFEVSSCSYRSHRK